MSGLTTAMQVVEKPRLHEALRLRINEFGRLIESGKAHFRNPSVAEHWLGLRVSLVTSQCYPALVCLFLWATWPSDLGAKEANRDASFLAGFG